MKNYNLGTIELEKGNYKKAISLLEKASPTPFKWLNLGNCYRAIGDTPKAISCYENGLAMNNSPAHPLIWNNLGLCYVAVGDSGISQFLNAITLDPTYNDARCNLAFSRIRMNPSNPLMWREYGYRFKSNKPVQLLGPFGTLYGKWWNGEKNCKVLLAEEQGIGDLIMFSRFKDQLEEEYSIKCDIYSSQDIPGINTIKYFNTNDYDYMMPIGDILGWLSKIEPSDGYITNTRRLNLEGLNIGIVWSGNTNHANDKFRSCNVERFKDLTAYAKLWSLNPAAKCPGWVNKCYIDNWGDTQKYINSMDLIITVDTSVAHMAGAMGKITWLLQPILNSDLRWGLGETNPFYTSVRSMRASNWDEMFNNLYMALSCALGGQQ